MAKTTTVELIPPVTPPPVPPPPPNQPGEDNSPAATPARPRRWRYILIAGLTIVALTAWYWWLKRSALNLPATAPLTLVPKQTGFFQIVKNVIFPPEFELPVQTTDRLNILLLGVGGPGHDGPYLSDTNLIISLKPSTRELALISIPRDLGAPIGNFGWRKINSAAALGEAKTPGGGAEFARQVFTQAFSLDIPYYVMLDFQAFSELVEAVGGVKINVPQAFTDTQYPGPNNSYQTIQFAAGPQVLSGEAALQFVRSRHGSNGESSDFARARRQQLVLSELKAELLSPGTYLNPLRLGALANSLTSHIQTNLDLSTLFALARLARELTGPPKTLTLDTSPTGLLVNTVGEQGAFILSPRTGNFDEIKAAIHNIFETNPASSTPPASPILGATAPSVQSSTKPLGSGPRVAVQNGTWRVGLAARWAAKLSDAGFTVVSVSNHPSRPVTTTRLYRLDRAAPTTSVALIEQMLHTTAVDADPGEPTSIANQPPASDPARPGDSGAAQLLIILGTDAKE